ncbi:MAG: gamma-glutamyltransferase, partial [Planctomycetes bacterium]|nr:gamma-glutamyltransferase [Planctomycetota bacterium]
MNAGRALAGVFAACFLLGAVGPGTVPAPNDLVARGKLGCVVSAEPRATAVGLQILAAGGNAVDAAVAVAFALAVTHPQAGNLGGGGFLVARFADGHTVALDFRERAPASATADMYLKVDGSVDEDKIQFGASAAGVPGSPAGLLHALHKYGTLGLPQVLAPAIRLAREGFVVDQFLAEDLAEAKADLGRFAPTRKVFFKDDRPLQQGEMLVQADLGATLERFAKGGLDGFYGGETQKLVIAAMQAGGGFVTARDLGDYQPRERQALRATYRGHEIVSMPPPSSGGVALLEMLGMLERFDLRGLGHGGSESMHLLAEVMRRAYADRSRWLGDPDHYAVPVEGLLAKDYLDKLAAGIDQKRRTEVQPGLPPGAKESDDTTHLSVVDKDGNAVAITTTINSTFGSCLVVDGAGFLLNNEMDDFSAKPGVPNQFGLVGGKANAIAPGKRMLSSMTPTIVAKDGQLRLVLGAPGGGRIITAVLQTLLNVVDHGMPLEQAVRAPRVHHQWLPDEIQYEALALSPDVRTALQAKGHTLAKRPRGIGQMFAIQIEPDGTRVGVCDHRSGGAAGA